MAVPVAGQLVQQDGAKRVVAAEAHAADQAQSAVQVAAEASAAAVELAPTLDASTVASSGSSGGTDPSIAPSTADSAGGPMQCDASVAGEDSPTKAAAALSAEELRNEHTKRRGKTRRKLDNASGQGDEAQDEADI